MTKEEKRETIRSQFEESIREALVKVADIMPLSLTDDQIVEKIAPALDLIDCLWREDN